jgi:two-component system sensor histidine kinase UhpB
MQAKPLSWIDGQAATPGEPLGCTAPSPAPAALDLPRQILRRAALVGLLALLAAAALGLHGAAQDIEDEVLAAQGLAQALQVLGSSPEVTPAQLQRLQQTPGLRHLSLEVRDAQGRTVWAPVAPVPLSAPMRWAMAWHRQWQALPEAQALRWQLHRSQGDWTVIAHISPDSERREALADLARLWVVLVLGLAALWLGLVLNIRKAFEPLAALLRAIEGMAPQGARALAALPAMPIRELAAITQALQHLAADLDQAQVQRRLLSQKVQGLQEEERNHLARELHDEMGQRLTALRLDLAWLSRRLANEPDLPPVLQAMTERCQEAQHDLRQVLSTLRPLGPGAGQQALPLARLVHLLQDLVAAWQSAAAAQETSALRVSLVLLQSQRQADLDGAAEPLPAVAWDTLWLTPALVLAVYRLSQEGLTNVARHAHARQARLQLQVVLAAQGPCALWWQLEDDGVGLPTQADILQRGNGMGGMQERVWALGGEWRYEPAAPAPRPGLRLRARLPWSGVDT